MEDDNCRYIPEPCDPPVDDPPGGGGGGTPPGDPSEEAPQPAVPAFPERDTRDLTRSTPGALRETVLVERQNYTSQAPEAVYRAPAQMVQELSTHLGDGFERMDIFRHVAGSLWTFEEGELRTIIGPHFVGEAALHLAIRTPPSNASRGVPFSVGVKPAVRIPATKVFQEDVFLVVHRDSIEALFSDNDNYEDLFLPDPGSPREEYNAASRLSIAANPFRGLPHINDVNQGRWRTRISDDPDFEEADLPRGSSIPAGFPLSSYKFDSSFKAPAAYFRAETIQEGEVIKDNVLLESVSDSSTEYPEGLSELDLLKSAYRIYAITELGMEADPTISTHDDFNQKFPAEQVELIASANSWIQQSLEQPRYQTALAESDIGTHVKISFNMHHDSDIAAVFKNQELDKVLLDMITKEENKQEILFTQVLNQQDDRTGEVLNDKVVTEYTPNNYQISRRDINRYLRGDANDMSYGDETMMKNEFPLGYALNTTLIPAVMGMFARTQERLIAEHHRTFAKILNEDLAYSQVVAYKIEKRDAETGEVIQNFYLFNDPDTEEFEFIDAQVFPFKRYTYSIYTINYVLGSKYRYQNMFLSTGALENLENNQELLTGKQLLLRDDLSNTDLVARYVGAAGDVGRRIFDNKAATAFRVRTERVESYIEAPYFKDTIRVSNLPPLYPNVTVEEAQDNQSGRTRMAEDRVNMFFSQRSGFEFEKPYGILEEDIQIFENMRRDQPFDRRGRISYETDNSSVEYEAFLLDTIPTSYSDFANGQRRVTSVPAISLQIRPNHRYYMTFRTRDKDGISNPSEIYTLMIVSTDTELRLEWDLFEQQTEQHQAITVQRAFSIEVSPEQAEVNYEAAPVRSDIPEEENRESVYTNAPQNEEFYYTAPAVENLFLGPGTSAESVWGKKFKFRIRSKTTGKTLDINAKFQAKRTKKFPQILGQRIAPEVQRNVQSTAAWFAEREGRVAPVEDDGY
tara:strand:+ start:36738 stop:39650 length:2913 start_codon:yes stop_codon:yes gene_type:complete